MRFDVQQFFASFQFLIPGIWVTLQYTVISIFFGLLGGVCVALMKISPTYVLERFARVYLSIFRGTPLLVQLTLIYYATPQLTGYQITAFEAGVLTFSLNSAAYVGEIIRGGILGVDRGQFEAAASMGIPYGVSMRCIILPQAIKTILPALVNEMINLLKESALVSVIGEMDLLRRANIIAAEKYIYFEPLLMVACIYYAMVMILAYVSRALEKRLSRSD